MLHNIYIFKRFFNRTAERSFVDLKKLGNGFQCRKKLILKFQSNKNAGVTGDIPSVNRLTLSSGLVMLTKTSLQLNRD